MEDFVGHSEECVHYPTAKERMKDFKQRETYQIMIFKRSSGAFWKIAGRDVRADAWRPVRMLQGAIMRP